MEKYSRLRQATDDNTAHAHCMLDRLQTQIQMGYILEQMLPKICESLMFLYRHRLSGMDMTLCDYDGRTALHLAAAEGHLECVTFLLEHCKVPHNPKDRSVPSQIARSPLSSLLNMQHSMTGCCPCHILIFLHASFEAFTAL
jgi:hypothetical protein